MEMGELPADFKAGRDNPWVALLLKKVWSAIDETTALTAETASRERQNHRDWMPFADPLKMLYPLGPIRGGVSS